MTALMQVSEAPTLTFVRMPRTGDELAMWRTLSGRSMQQAASEAGYAYNTWKDYERRGGRRIPRHTTLAVAALDAGILPDDPGAFGRRLAKQATDVSEVL